MSYLRIAERKQGNLDAALNYLKTDSPSLQNYFFGKNPLRA